MFTQRKEDTRGVDIVSWLVTAKRFKLLCATQSYDTVSCGVFQSCSNVKIQSLCVRSENKTLVSAQ